MNNLVSQEKLLSVVRSQLIELLRFTTLFLNKHQLNWWLGYGSAIGAVRHKGMIPWDDDIDIIMPRDDYNKLLKLQDELIKAGYSLTTMENTPLYHFPFAKIMNKTSTIWEMKEHPFILGSYIDIFPLDSVDSVEEASDNAKEFLGFLHKVQWGLTRYGLKDIFDSLKHMRLGQLFIILRTKLYALFIKKNKKNLYDYVGHIGLKSGEMYVNYCSIYGVNRDCVDKNYFAKTVKGSFEGIDVNLPSGYDEYLRKIYGDYMQLPPKEKQVSHHHRYYENFKEPLSVDDVKIRMKAGETIVL